MNAFDVYCLGATIGMEHHTGDAAAALYRCQYAAHSGPSASTVRQSQPHWQGHRGAAPLSALSCNHDIMTSWSTESPGLESGRYRDGRNGNRTGNTGHLRSFPVNNGHSKTQPDQECKSLSRYDSLQRMRFRFPAAPQDITPRRWSFLRSSDGAIYRISAAPASTLTWRAPTRGRRRGHRGRRCARRMGQETRSPSGPGQQSAACTR